MIYETIVAPVLAGLLAIAAISAQLAFLSLSANAGFRAGFYGFQSQFKGFLISVTFSLLSARILPRTSSPGLCSSVVYGTTVTTGIAVLLGWSIQTTVTVTPAVAALFYWFFLEKKSESLKKLLFWSYNKVRGKGEKKWEV
ncbi:unnamed protein product [Bursaphelenchus okinawaensis]|uniref:Uncharacterized protein n=1 Tax=Bursaphelenchus okinawaensis TaxID=465554 RepID=A0A811LPI8_9BILA|nr:unnamed protein product [Bursaphelenchus okinawaensis]CAG9125459.1 unnamed protein product [Bursaphelenchus okinawaensis]